MSRFSVSQMAMTGFRVVRENPAAVALWALLQAVGMFAVLGAMVSLIGGPFARLQSLSREPGASPDPHLITELMTQFVPFLLVILPLSLAFGAVTSAAMNRIVLRPRDKAFGFLRIGAAEWRQFLLGLQVMLVAAGAYVAVILAVIVGAVGIGFASKAAPVAGVLLAVAGGLGLVAAAIYVTVRLSLASARTFATGRVDLFGSWDVTRGHFWPILGTYVLAVFLAIVVMSMGSAVVFCIAAVTTGLGPTSDAMIHPDMATPASYFTPSQIVYLALNAVVSALVLPIQATPAAAMYAALTDGPPPAPVIEGGLYVPKA